MNIKLYVRAGDPYSDMIKNLLKYYNVACEIIDISHRKEKQHELFELSGQYNTPVLQIDEKVYTGFDREKIKELLGLAQNKQPSAN